MIFITFIAIAFLVSVIVLFFYRNHDLDLRIRELEKAKVDKMIERLVERDLRRPTYSQTEYKAYTGPEKLEDLDLDLDFD